MYTYSGVRPLPFTGEKESRITRRHFIRQHSQFANLLSIVGGKLTTYRSLAEEAVDLSFRKMNRAKQIGACYPAPLRQPATAFSGIYGSRAANISSLIAADPELAEEFDDETGAVAAEVVHAFKNEMAMTLAIAC